MTQQPYTYTALRYVHDVRTGEFLNVGVVLHVSSTSEVLFRTRMTYGRAKNVFPDLDGEAFRTAMSAVRRSLAGVAKDAELSGLFGREHDAATIARRALPADDSTLQWAPVGSGITDDSIKTFERLYARLVTQYDIVSPDRRTDSDVWRPVREKLQARAISIELQEKVIVGANDEIAFRHAWKNGIWHAYEPLSLDMADADGIKEKARRWRGHLAAVADGSSEPVKLSFIVGAPRNASLDPAYRNALAILLQADFSPRVFEDSQIDQLIDEIEDEVRAHAQHPA
jgi:hypothetical protein